MLIETVEKHEMNFCKHLKANTWDTEDSINDGTKFEIKTYSFIEVDYSTFRSWCGERRINGKAYRGPVYYNLSLKPFSKEEAINA